MTRYYCVISTTTADVLYAGTSEAATAAALDPGTVYGYGRTRRAAWWAAVHRRADVLRSDGKIAAPAEVPDWAEVPRKEEP